MLSTMLDRSRYSNLKFSPPPCCLVTVLTASPLLAGYAEPFCRSRSILPPDARRPRRACAPAASAVAAACPPRQWCGGLALGCSFRTIPSDQHPSIHPSTSIHQRTIGKPGPGGGRWRLAVADGQEMFYTGSSLTTLHDNDKDKVRL